jgi:hypothetical protein
VRHVFIVMLLLRCTKTPFCEQSSMPAWAPATGVEKPRSEINVELVGGGEVFGQYTAVAPSVCGGRASRCIGSRSRWGMPRWKPQRSPAMTWAKSSRRSRRGCGYGQCDYQSVRRRTTMRLEVNDPACMPLYAQHRRPLQAACKAALTGLHYA